MRSWPEVTELGTGREERGEDPWIERLRERLGDDDVGVVSASVNLICELARKDPGKYLPLAPELFGLLTASTNNWMLIKIIKLVRSLCHPGSKCFDTDDSCDISLRFLLRWNLDWSVNCCHL